MSYTTESEKRIVGYLENLEKHGALPPGEAAEMLGFQADRTVAAIGVRSDNLTSTIRTAAGGGHNVQFLETPRHEIPLAADSCDVVVVANLSPLEAADPAVTLCEAARLLRERGRLVLIGLPQAGSDAGPHLKFDEMVRLLEANTWEIHRHGESGPFRYLIEAGVCDDSVQS